MAANLIRMTTAFLCLMGLELLHSGGRRPAGLSRRSIAILAVAGVMGAFSSMMYLTAVHYAGAAKASVLSSTAPLFGLPISVVFLHERVSSRVAAGTLITVSGIWLVLGG